MPVLVLVDLSARKAPVENPHWIILVAFTTTHPGAEVLSGPKALRGGETVTGPKALTWAAAMMSVMMPPVIAERRNRSEKCDQRNQYQESKAILSLAVSTIHSQPASVSTSSLTVGTSGVPATGSKVIVQTSTTFDALA